MRGQILYGDPRPAAQERESLKQSASLNVEILGFIPFEEYSDQERGWLLHATPEDKHAIFNEAVEEGNDSVILGMWGMVSAHIDRDKFNVKKTGINEVEKRDELFKDLQKLTQLEAEIKGYFMPMPTIASEPYEPRRGKTKVIESNGSTLAILEAGIRTGNPTLMNVSLIAAIIAMSRYTFIKKG